MDNLIGTAANYLVTAVLAALVGWLGSQMRRERDERDKRKTHDDAMEMGMRERGRAVVSSRLGEGGR